MNKPLTAIKAIRAYCLDCSSGNDAEVRNCVVTDCSLYSFRMGKNSNIKARTRKANPEALKLARLRKSQI